MGLWAYGVVLFVFLFLLCSGPLIPSSHICLYLSCQKGRQQEGFGFFSPPSLGPCSKSLTSPATLLKERSRFSEKAQPDCKSGLNSFKLFLLNFSAAPGRTFAHFQQQKGMASKGEGGRDVHSTTGTRFPGSWIVRFYCYDSIFSVL